MMTTICLFAHLVTCTHTHTSLVMTSRDVLVHVPYICMHDDMYVYEYARYTRDVLVHVHMYPQRKLPWFGRK
jgi:hypothetical protein